MKIWFTSDFHLNHNKPFIYEARGFSSIEEHDEVIIENYNSLIKDDDQVYILGDCYMGSDHEKAIQYLKKLKGNKFLIYGNHDTDNKLTLFAKEKIFQSIYFGNRLQTGKKIFLLSHYPQLVVNYEDKFPIYSIHGHNHSKEKFGSVYHCYNVCLDAHNCYPVNIDTIVSDINYYRSRGEYPWQ